MTEHKPLQKFYLGTAVKITTILSVDTATTTIKIVDPVNTTKVNNVAMTKDANKVYSYTYQSASSDQDGDYIITISATTGGYTTVTQDRFTLIEQEPDIN